MDEMLSNFPFWGAWIFMYILGTLRGQATYWLGRGASSAATHVGSEEVSDSKWAKIKAWLNSDRTKTGRTLVHKIGVVAVPLSYLTVGLQTAVLAAAGLVRIQWWKFSVAQIPGAMAWATIYSGVGLAGWSAILALFTGDGIVPALALILVLTAVIVAIVFLTKEVRKESAAKTKAKNACESTCSKAVESVQDDHVESNS